MIKIEIHNPTIQIIRARGGSDCVLITDGQRLSGCWPYTEPLTYRLEVARGHGEEWCAHNFPGVPVDVIASH